MAHSWLSCTYRWVTTHRSPIPGTRFTSLLVARVCSSTESGVIPLELDPFCSFRLTNFTVSRIFRQTLSSGLLSTDRKGERWRFRERFRFGLGRRGGCLPTRLRCLWVIPATARWVCTLFVRSEERFLGKPLTEGYLYRYLCSSNGQNSGAQCFHDHLC